MLQYILTESSRYSVAELAQMAIEGGCGWIDLHLPSLSDTELRELLAPDIIGMCREAGVFLTIDDREAVARELGLHGVRYTLQGAPAEVPLTPLVGPLVDLWGFGSPGDRPEPDSAAVRRTLQLTGMNKTDMRGPVVKRAPGMKFDFAAIAKGYGVDRVAEMLRRNGCENYLVEVGGDVAALGLNPRGEVWHVKIEMPDGGDGGSMLELDDMCVATSGNYRNYRERPDGSRYGHTISPLTGYPVMTDVLSASVVAPTCATADALATACMAMGAEAAADGRTAAMLSAFPHTRAILVLAPELQGQPLRVISLVN